MYNSNPEPMRTITVRIPAWLKDALWKEADRRRCSVSVLARDAFEKILAEQEQEEK